MQPVDAPSPARSTPKAALVFALAAACAAAAIFAWHKLLALSLLGWDAYPLIASSTVHSSSDLARMLGSQLMSGRYPLGEYYRPLVQLSFALDARLWGYEAWGFHLTDLCILVVSVFAVFLAARRLFGASALAAATTAGLFVALHPVAWDVLPAPARRADALASCFVLFALAATPVDRSRGFGFRALLAGVCALAAFASKESGALAAPLVAVAAGCASREPSFGARARFALRAAAPALLFALAFYAWRAHIVAGLGGSSKAELTGAFTRMCDVIASASQSVFPPLSSDASIRASDRLAAGALIVLSGVAVACALQRGSDPVGERRPLSVILVWGLMLVCITGVSGENRSWYAVPFVPLAALVVGYVAEHGRSLFRSRTGFSGAVVLGLALLYLAFVARASGALADTPRVLADASRGTVDFLARLDMSVRTLGRRGSTLEVDALRPEMIETFGGRETHVLTMTDYSAQAYLDLAFPDAKIRVERGGSRTPPAAASDELVILLQPPKSAQ